MMTMVDRRFAPGMCQNIQHELTTILGCLLLPFLSWKRHSAECLTYALSNRREWEAKGEKIVLRMVDEYNASKWGDHADDGPPPEQSIDGTISANQRREN
jgi:hypothetical protein